MARHLFRLVAIGIVVFLAVHSSWAQEKMVANPYYNSGPPPNRVRPPCISNTQS